MDAIQTSDIKYIHSKECRKHYRNNWWEKYNGLAIKILIQTDNIKLFKVISKSIIRTTIMLQNIAEYSNEIMFNEYIKHIKYIPCRVETKDYFECHKYARDKPENFYNWQDYRRYKKHNYICEIYHCPKVNHTIKKLCYKIEKKNIDICDEYDDKKINEYNNKKCREVHCYNISPQRMMDRIADMDRQLIWEYNASREKVNNQYNLHTKQEKIKKITKIKKNLYNKPKIYYKIKKVKKVNFIKNIKQPR